MEKSSSTRNPAAAPAFLHVSHAKAGSTWIYQILQTLYGKQVAPRFGSDLGKLKYEPGKIYAAAFLTREQVLDHPGLSQLPRFVVIRDLRDTAISKYFSMKVSHQLDSSGAMEQWRKALRSVSQEEGLTTMLETGFNLIPRIQKSWIGHGERILRYEDLIANDLPVVRKLLVEDLGLNLSDADVERAVIASRFENVYGRKLGETDVSSHGRHGAPGDWKNHFTPALKRLFHEHYGDLLIATGYEPDDRWTRE